MFFYFTIGSEGFGPFRSIAEAEAEAISKVVSATEPVYFWRGQAKVEGGKLTVSDGVKLVETCKLNELITRMPKGK